MGLIVLSHFQVRPILAALAAGRPEVSCSLDLGLTTAVCPLTATHFLLPDGQSLSHEQLAAIAGDELGCYRVAGGEIEKIQRFSAAFDRFYSLMPTAGAPTMLISGIPMHRIKGTEPQQDTLSKLRATAVRGGHVLDTAMGLGYTAIAAARLADQVTTIELDPAVVEICRANPWSQALFDNPKINRRIGDAAVEVAALPDGAFTRIIHDPPVMSLAGGLYAGTFYRELYRVLRGNGRLFHYIGDPDSRSGASVTRGVVRRLREAGFRRVVPRPEAFGVVAHK